MLEMRKNARIGTAFFLLSCMRGAFLTTHYYTSILSVTFWQAFWSTMRPYLLFVSGAAALAGLAFIEDPGPLRLGLAFFPLFLS